MGALRQRLGIRNEWLPREEYLHRREEREHADTAARVLYERVKAWRMDLLRRLHDLNSLQSTAHSLGPNFEETWNALEMIDHDRPGILAELTFLEESPAADLIRFLNADAEMRGDTISGVVENGGFYVSNGKFIWTHE